MDSIDGVDFFYPTRTYKEIHRIERGCSYFIVGNKYRKRDYLFKYVMNAKDGWYHVMQSIGRKKYMYKSVQKVRYLYRHYIIPNYNYYDDSPVVFFADADETPYDSYINVNKAHKKYHVTTYQYKK